MKTKRILSALMSVVMVFVMFSVLTVLTVTEAPLTAKAVSATKQAIYVGPSTRKNASNQTYQVPSAIILPISSSGLFGDDTVARITAKVRMLSGTKPYVQMFRAASSDRNGIAQSTPLATTASNGTVAFYQKNGVGNGYWQDNSTSSVSSGTFTCDITFDNLPGDENAFYGDVWDEDNGNEYQYRTTGLEGRDKPISCVIAIGNGVMADSIAGYSSGGTNYYNYSSEFIISDISIKITNKKGSGSASNGTELAPATATLDTGKVYSVVGNKLNGSSSAQGNRNFAHNHLLQAKLGVWSILSTDEDTVRQVTVADDYLTTTHTYTQHPETTYENEYYTCSDFGSTKFEKIGNCYSVIDSDTSKKAFVIKSMPGDTHTGNSGENAAYSNIVIPMNIHKYYSAYNAPSCSSSNLKEPNGNVKLKVTFNAKRLSGTGQPVLGHAYANPDGGTANNVECRNGAPVTSTKRAHNNDVGPPSEASPNSGVSSTYNAATGEFTAYLQLESGYYKQMSKTGISNYLTIGLAEHTNASGSAASFDAIASDSSFIISNIKFVFYGLSYSDTVLFDGANQAPAMTKANCDATTIYKYQPQNVGDTVSGSESGESVTTRDIAFRNLPLGKYSVEGAVQYVSLIDDNACNRGCHSLTHYAATDNTREYWRCATCSKNYADPYASEVITDTSATKKIMFMKTAGNEVLNTVMPLDFAPSSSYNGTHYYLFTCKMRLYGAEVPTISVMRAAELGGVGARTLTGNTNSRSASAGSGDSALFTSYDEATHTYKAVVKITRKDPKDVNQFGFVSTNTGAHNVLLLGNAKNAVSGGTADTRKYTGFAFAEPSLKLLTSETNINSVTGDNLLPALSDKTLFESTSLKGKQHNNYSYIGTTVDAAGNVTAANNVLEAPVGKYTVQGDPTYFYFADYSDNFFASSPTSHMVKIAGYEPNSTPVGFSAGMFLEDSTTYQVDLDYRVFGGIDLPNLVINDCVTGGSMTAITPTVVAASTTNTHLCYRFTTRSGLRMDNGGNAMIQVGLKYGSCTTSSEYVANLQLRKVSGGSPTGRNLIPNGDFSLGTVGVINYGSYWTRLPLVDGTEKGFNGSYQYSYMANELLAIPSNFFNGSADPASDSGIALKITPGSNNQYLYMNTQLYASTYYRLSFKYNFQNTGTSDASLTLPTITQNTRHTDKTNTSTTLTPTSRNSAGSSIITCDFQVPSTATQDPKADNSSDGNTQISFNFGTDATTKTFYITELKLYKLTGSGGSATGTNLIGNMNAIFDASHYTSVGLNSVGNTYNMTTAITDGNYALSNSPKRAAVARDYANGWLISSTSGVTASLMKVPNGFFDAKTGSTRVSTMRHLILDDGEVTTDNYNPLYNPNGDGTKGDIKDLVHAKRLSVLNSMG